jgi:hypothetical protein
MLTNAINIKHNSRRFILVYLGIYILIYIKVLEGRQAGNLVKISEISKQTKKKITELGNHITCL